MPSRKQMRAYAAIRRAIAREDLVAARNRRCHKCGEQATEYHHPNYDEPLNVVPLCNVCHKQEHKRNEMRTRTSTLYFCVSSEEKREIKGVAASYNLCVSDFLRRMTRWVKETRPMLVVQPERERETA